MVSTAVLHQSAAVREPEGTVLAQVGSLPRVSAFVLRQVFTVREGLVAGLAGELRVGGASAILKVAPERAAVVEDTAAEGALQHLHPFNQIHGSHASPPYFPSHVQPDHPSLKQEDTHP